MNLFHPRAFAISSSDFPAATAISTNAPEMASLVPSYIISGVTSTPKFLAKSLSAKTLASCSIICAF